MLKLLHLLDPEHAHRAALWGLSHGFAPKQQTGKVATHLFGKPLQSLVGLAGGADKNAVALAGWQQMGLGFVEAGTVTLHPRKGNPAPRIWRQKDNASLVNWLGLPNHGLEAFASNLAVYRETYGGKDFCVGVSIATPDNKPEELSTITQSLAPYADFFTLNASCPNVESHSIKSAMAEISQQLAAALAGAGGKPLLVKLAPIADVATLRAMVAVIMEKPVAGFIACNTIPPASAMMIPEGLRPAPWPVHQGSAVGGYSGPALLPISRAMVKNLREILGKDAVIIGIGGVASVADAKSLLEAGANAVQLYTALTYQGAGLIKTLNNEL